MKFFCNHPEIEEEVTPFRCVDCKHLKGCTFLPPENSSHIDDIQKVITLLLEKSERKKQLQSSNMELWQNYWNLKWDGYARVIKVFYGGTKAADPRLKRIKNELDDLINLADKIISCLRNISALWAWPDSPFIKDDHAFDLYCRLTPDLEEFKSILSKAVPSAPRNK